MDRRLSFIELFSGAGGLSEGFLQSGKFQSIAHVEWEIPMVNTLRQRLIDAYSCNVEYCEEEQVILS